MRRGKKQFAVLLGIVLVFGGLAAGCAGGAETQGGQPTETAPTVNTTWDATNPNSLPSSPISTSPDETLTYTQPASEPDTETKESTMVCNGHTFRVSDLSDMSVKKDKEATIQAAFNLYPPYTFSWKCTKDGTNVDGGVANGEKPVVFVSGLSSDGTPDSVAILSLWANNYPDDPVLIN